jgi:hypothetical protein
LIVMVGEKWHLTLTTPRAIQLHKRSGKKTPRNAGCLADT